MCSLCEKISEELPQQDLESTICISEILNVDDRLKILEVSALTYNHRGTTEYGSRWIRCRPL
jgi:hypothetical protein